MKRMNVKIEQAAMKAAKGSKKLGHTRNMRL